MGEHLVLLQVSGFHGLLDPGEVCCAESEFAEIQEWFNSRHKPWNATVMAIDGEGELPEMGRSSPGHFLFSASPLMQEFWRDVGDRKMDLLLVCRNVICTIPHPVITIFLWVVST